MLNQWSAAAVDGSGGAGSYHPSSSFSVSPQGGVVGELLRQEYVEAGNRMLCHYRNLSGAQAPPLALTCELGCCEGGCCNLDELSRQ